MSEPELVNVVGGGNLNKELQIEALCEDIESEEARYEPEQWPGLYIRFEENQPAILIFSSGKFFIAGADSEDQILKSNNKLIKKLSQLGIDINDPSFEIRNRVYTYQFDREFNLDTLILGLGLENSEYEPEQFPGLFYDNPDGKGVFLIFRTGKVVLTGVKTDIQATKSFESLHDEIAELLSQ